MEKIQNIEVNDAREVAKAERGSDELRVMIEQMTDRFESFHNDVAERNLTPEEAEASAPTILFLRNLKFELNDAIHSLFEEDSIQTDMDTSALKEFADEQQLRLRTAELAAIHNIERTLNPDVDESGQMYRTISIEHSESGKNERHAIEDQFGNDCEFFHDAAIKGTEAYEKIYGYLQHTENTEELLERIDNVNRSLDSVLDKSREEI